MAKGTRGRRRLASRQYRPTPYDYDVSKLNQKKRSTKVFEEKKDWKDANCSVCMEYPHNAVLLLCSSHDKGCRPYMCGTSCRYSNCLDQYKKAYTKVTSPHRSSHPWLGSVEPVSLWPSVEKREVTELACPLCRGQVKGWTVVEPAREYLNSKKRTCMHDNCLFVGAYKELRKHVRAEHPSAKPREVDPVEKQKWSRLEREREREDVISTIRSSMPGAVVFGDYVIEGSHYGLDSDEDEPERNTPFEMGIENNLNVFLLLNALGPTGNASSYRGMRWHERDSNRSLDRGGGFDSTDDSDDESGGDDDVMSLTSHLRRQGGGGGGGDDDGMSLASRLRRQGRVLLGRSGRRQRRREASGGQR